MLKRLLPKRIDNRFRGHALALWLYAPLALMKLAFGLAHVFRADGGAQSVSTMPLDTYPADAAQNIIGLMARMGLEQIVLGLIFLLVLFRYRSLVPLMFLLMAAYWLGLEGISAVKPLALAGVSGIATVALALQISCGVGLVLSLIGRRYREDALALG